jgi:tetratricopeptide (TPR) repeat protein
MRLRRAVVCLAGALAVASPAGAQDFDPRGRHHGKPAAPTTPAAAPRAPAPRPGGAPGAPAPETGAPGGVTPAALLERYTRVVLAQPGSPFPLQRLAQLYRERDGNLAQAIAAFEARAARGDGDAFAATVGLAGLLRLDGRRQEAVAAYERAASMRPGDASPLLAMAHLTEESGDGSAARSLYERALTLQTVGADREQTLRSLISLALDAGDFDGARGYHRALVKLEPTSLFVLGELGRDLFARAEYARAAEELKAVVSAARGDNRALAPALKELGRAQARAHQGDQALATLRQALAAAGAQTALRAEIYGIVAEIYRADQKLPQLVKELEDEHPGDLARLSLLGGLYEETGDGKRALEVYRRALAVDPRQIDLRLRVIRLLEASGDLDEAIREREALVRAAPDSPQFVFDECTALLERGDRARALELLGRLEARAGADDEVLSRVAELYAHMGDDARSLRVLQKLADRGGASDPGPLVDLGDRYFQDGKVPMAVATWKRMLTTIHPRARALAALGDVYLEHDMTADAVASYKEAVAAEPGNLAYKKALAAAHERAHAYREALALYREIADRAKSAGDVALGRECRARMVVLWGLERVLDQQLPGLRKAFGEDPPDLDAGRMLAEGLLHLGRVAEAEGVLRRLVELAPADVDAHLTLERALVKQGKLQEAIATLEHLAQVQPTRARELYQRMAQYALQTYRDDDAVKYAARAVELNPDDAEGHRRLGEMYRSRQDLPRAIAELRAALAKNDRLFLVHFELADLLLARGETEEADRLLRRVVRGAPDAELIAQAARLSMQINLGKGTAESLEQDLLPMAIGNPQQPVYRRLLVELYGSLTFGLVQRARHGAPEEAEASRAALSRIGARAVKPLLDALADADAGQQRIAIDVLSYVHNRNAALPLFAFATGGAEPAIRARAMLACGSLGDASLVPRLEAYLLPKDPAAADVSFQGDPVALAAAWALASMNDPRALPPLRRLAAGAAPGVRAVAVIGLGAARDAASAGAIAAMARAPDAGNAVRAAAAYALGELQAVREAPALLELAEEGAALPRRAAIVALARMAVRSRSEPPWQTQAVQALADAVFAGPDGATARGGTAQPLAVTAASSLGVLAARGDGAARRWAEARDPLRVPEGTLDVDALLDALATAPALEPAAATAVLARFAGPIERAALTALHTSADAALVVLDALGSGRGELRPFVAAGDTGPAAEAARPVVSAIAPGVLPLASHPDAAVRARAVAVAGELPGDAAAATVIGALEDPSEAVQRAALAALATGPEGAAAARSGAVARVSAFLAQHPSWALRVLAARALGRLGAAGAPGAAAPLAAAATHDGWALVRQAALEALAQADPSGAREVAARLEGSDPEPRVRETAALLATGR